MIILAIGVKTKIANTQNNSSLNWEKEKPSFGRVDRSFVNQEKAKARNPVIARYGRHSKPQFLMEKTI